MSRTTFLIPLIAYTIGISAFASQNDKKSNKEAARKNFSDRMNWHYAMPDTPESADQPKSTSDDAVKKELLTLFKQGMSFENLPLLQNASAQKFQQYVNDHYAALVAKAIKDAEKNDSASHFQDNKHKRICMTLVTLKDSYHPLKQRRDLVADYNVEARDERNVKEYDEKLIIINNIKPCLARSIAQRLLPTSYHLHILPARYKCALTAVCGFALLGAYTIFSSLFCNKKISQHTPTETNDNLHA